MFARHVSNGSVSELVVDVEDNAKEWTCGRVPLRKSSQWMQGVKRGESVEK
jgi:hypothetical protein